MDENLQKVIPILEKYEQRHLVNFYDELEADEKQNLIKQIEETNFDFLEKLYVNSFKNEIIDCKRITPLPYYSKYIMTDEEKAKYIKIGEQIINDEKVAVITLAGGMGSRLGYKGPKGAYEIDIPPKKSLFEFICDKLKYVHEKNSVYLPWYIMTSPSNDKRTKEFFIEHNYFDYPKEKIYFFKQDTINILDINGKIMLDGIGTLKKDSNGNGDVFKAFQREGLEKTLKNIEWLSIGGVDNILLDLIDPLFIGLTASNNSEIGSKSIRKDRLNSKQWVFAKLDGKPDIINSSFLTENMCYSKNEKNQYKYNQTNILSHLIRKDVFLKCADMEIPYHRAFKKTDYINDEGMKMVVKEPNSFKFEKFIFDVFKYFENFTLLEVNAQMEFAPIKAFTGNETPETALEKYLNKCGKI